MESCLAAQSALGPKGPLGLIKVGPGKSWIGKSQAIELIQDYHFSTTRNPGHGKLYEGWFTHSHNHAISMQPLGIGHTTIPHMKAKDAPFQLIYGSLIYSKGLQSTSPK